jgi:hypothetical protein
MPGRASSTLKPNRHRTSNSISASRGKNSRAIPAISQGRLMRDPPLTTADGKETISELPLDFLCFF